MKRLSKVIIVTTLVTLGTVSAASFARDYGHHGRGGHGPGFNIERMADRLDLSNTQLAEIRAIVDNVRTEKREYRANLRDNREQIKALVKDGAADTAQLQVLADARGDLVAELTMQRAQVRAAIRAVLTPDQQAQFDELRESRRHRSRQR